jgi:hypothetical protein
MLKIRTVSNYLPTGVERRLMSSDFKIRKLGEQAQFRGVHSMTLLFICLFIAPFNAMSQLIKPIYLSKLPLLF